MAQAKTAVAEVEEGAGLDLKALEMEAALVDAEVDAAGPAALLAGQEAAEEGMMVDANKTAISMILDLAVPVLGAMYPSLPAIYSEQQRAMIATSLGPVLTKYGIDLSDLGANYKEEIGALMVCGPVAWATVQAVKADLAARTAKPPRRLP